MGSSKEKMKGAFEVTLTVSKEIKIERFAKEFEVSTKPRHS